VGGVLEQEVVGVLEQEVVGVLEQEVVVGVLEQDVVVVMVLDVGMHFGPQGPQDPLKSLVVIQKSFHQNIM
jgi:hypothetical protein